MSGIRGHDMTDEIKELKKLLEKALRCMGATAGEMGIDDWQSLNDETVGEINKALEIRPGQACDTRCSHDWEVEWETSDDCDISVADTSGDAYILAMEGVEHILESITFGEERTLKIRFCLQGNGNLRYKMEKRYKKFTCGECTWLGQFGDVDLYHCAQGGHPTVLAVRSSEPSDYLSGMVFADNFPELAEAKRRALAKGLNCERGE